MGVLVVVVVGVMTSMEECSRYADFFFYQNICRDISI
jgi:hypothetical protein